ncbi:MAG TPA: FG-GAP and VCBS repeat-containing protein [Planctomycetota bacterium]|nr:FG-GAP and VCBS repeat-containing protein [Planctomycetota bacterium]
MRHFLCLACFAILSAFAAEPDLPNFEAQTIDANVGIGYATTVADIDGDGKPDILLVDKKQICWYHNPDWKKYVICENVTKQDNVCMAVRDIDGDGKAEIAIGAEWNPGDTVNSGSVHYLIPPADRTQKWDVVTLPHEPTVHRMKWVKYADGKFRLVVAPLHGRGNKNAQGDGVKVLAYTVPADPRKVEDWKTEVVDDSMHITHNFDVLDWDGQPGEEIVLAGKEGVLLCTRGADGWAKKKLIASKEQGFDGAGEVRVGKLRGGGRFFATVEPFHGTKAAIYTEPGDKEEFWRRRVIDETLKEGHAVACADLLGAGYDQVLVGWRTPNAAGKVGINMYLPPASPDGEWKKVVVDDNTMACEDLVVADLNGDGRPDIIASGRATHNLVVYWNKK